MNSLLPTRISTPLTVGLALMVTVSSLAQPPVRRQPAPVERREGAGQPVNSGNRPNGENPVRPAVGPGGNQHLAQWMDQHRNLPIDQQQAALDREPGFHQLPADQQQRMHQRLTQLNQMPPQRQQQVIARTELMERLQPGQRQQVRGALAQLGDLPEDRRRAVSRTFRSLQAMPPGERQAYLNSPQYRSQFSDQERGTLNNLMQVAPILPR